jgi:uncharacterized protein YyaL (SSP411 family)
MDLVTDHCLALHWSRHSDEPLSRFARRAGNALQAAGRCFLQAGHDEPRAEEFAGLLLSYATEHGMESVMHRTARRLRRPEFALAASRAVDHLRRDLWRDGRLYASWKDGRTGAPAFLDDHAFLADALLELLQVRWRADDLAFAVDLAEALLERFEDRDDGGFWFTAHDAEALFHRPKTFADEALPAGNGVAARVLARLGTLLGEPRYLAAAERTLRAAWAALAEQPHAHASLCDALEEWLAPIEIVIVRGAADPVAAWQQELDALHAPRRLVFGIPADAVDLPPALAARRAGDDTLAYVCEGSVCGPPLPTLARLVHRLRDGVELAADVDRRPP